MSEKQWLDTFEIQYKSHSASSEALPHIYCANCDSLFWSIQTPDPSASITAQSLLARSWKPITLECTCGARCTILNGQICEPCPTTGAS